MEYEAIIGIAYRLDGKVFAAAGTSGKAQLFDRTTRKALLSWDACLGGLSNIVFSPDGSQLAVMSNETNDAKVFDAAFGGELLVLKGHTKTTEVLTITWMELAFSRPGAMRLHGSEMRRPVSL